MGRTFPTSVAAPVLLGTFIRSPGKVRPFPSQSTDFKHCSGVHLAYADAENCGNSAASLEIVAAVAASSSASGLRGVPAGNPRALSAVLTAGMNGADMIASISG